MAGDSKEAVERMAAEIENSECCVSVGIGPQPANVCGSCPRNTAAMLLRLLAQRDAEARAGFERGVRGAMAIFDAEPNALWTGGAAATDIEALLNETLKCEGCGEDKPLSSFDGNEFEDAHVCSECSTEEVASRKREAALLAPAAIDEGTQR